MKNYSPLLNDADDDDDAGVDDDHDDGDADVDDGEDYFVKDSEFFWVKKVSNRMSQFYVERDRPIFLPEFKAKAATDEMSAL